MGYEWVDVHVFEGLDGGVGADVGADGVEDGVHGLHGRGVVAMCPPTGGGLEDVTSYGAWARMR